MREILLGLSIIIPMVIGLVFFPLVMAGIAVVVAIIALAWAIGATILGEL
jgi:hypothetical protein